MGITRLTDTELDELVGRFVANYGHTYGRAMMQGSIRASIGVTFGAVSQRRVSDSLRRIAPGAFEARTRDLIERTNPIPYYAPFFGYKVRMDQNEKIAQRFGCTHVALIDGCSRMMVGYSSMPVKNPILVYEFVFRPAIIKYGLWDQLRVDHGTEFFLCIFVQDLLKRYRFSQERLPWRQTASTENYTIERFWPEMNSRVNYPIKRAMIYISEENQYDMSDPVIKYCFSFITSYIASDAAQHLVTSWNHHRVPGASGCVPINNMNATKRTVKMFEPLVPTTSEAVRMYEESGGQLSRNFEFGFDPLGTIEHAYETRISLFKVRQPSGKELFSKIVHNEYDTTKLALEYFHELTLLLSDEYGE